MAGSRPRTWRSPSARSTAGCGEALDGKPPNDAAAVPAAELDRLVTTVAQDVGAAEGGTLHDQREAIAPPSGKRQRITGTRRSSNACAPPLDAGRPQDDRGAHRTRVPDGVIGSAARRCLP